MKINYVIIILMTATPLFSHGQHAIKPVQYRKGIYKSYAEFRSNSPSVTEPFKIILTDSAAQYYKVELSNGKKPKGAVFGFCDGKDIYVHGMFSEGFHRLEYVGKWSYFFYRQPRNTFLTRSYPDYLVIVSEGNYIRIYAVRRIKAFQRLLAKNNPELSKQYNALDKDGKLDKMIDFLIKLNEEYNQKLSPVTK